MVIHTRPARPFLVVEPAHTELAVAATPHRHLVVVHPDDVADLPVRHPFGGQQHDPGPSATRASTVPDLTRRSNTARSPPRNINGGSRMTTSNHITVIYAVDP